MTDPISDDTVFKFQKDFDTQKICTEHIGRIILGDGSCVRIWFGPRGLSMSIPVSDHIYVQPKFKNEVIFAGNMSEPIEFKSLKYILEHM